MLNRTIGNHIRTAAWHGCWSNDDVVSIWKDCVPLDDLFGVTVLGAQAGISQYVHANTTVWYAFAVDQVAGYVAIDSPYLRSHSVV